MKNWKSIITPAELIRLKKVFKKVKFKLPEFMSTTLRHEMFPSKIIHAGQAAQVWTPMLTRNDGSHQLHQLQ